MKLLLFFFLSAFSLCLYAQENAFVDEKYYEDQIYIGTQYNRLIDNISGLNNTGVPYSFEVGFIKDLPINKRRNIGFGLGVGYSYDILRPNISLTPNGDSFDIEINNNFSSFEYLSHNIEIPFEFRWRTSTATNNSFWRIYTGASYINAIRTKTKLSTESQSVSYTDISLLRKNNYTVYTSIGYGTWNFHIKYYLLSPFVDGTKTTNGTALNFNQLKIGILFYIL